MIKLVHTFARSLIFLSLTFGVYIIVGLYLLEYFQYQINLDGTAMISIAKAFKAGDFYSGISAYWGLLYSFLLTPFLFISQPHLMSAVKFYQLTVGFLGLLAFNRLLKVFSLNPLIEAITLLAAVPIFLYFVYYTTSVDLLFATLLLFYLSIIFNPSYSRNIINGFWCGILGGLLFLAKEYAFYYFLGHFFLYHLLHFISTKENLLRKNIVKQFVVGITIFLVVVFFWSILLDVKYQSPMIGARGEVNLGLTNPRFQQYPMFDQGLFPLPNPHGLSVWDDPTYLKLESWNPIGSTANLEFTKGKFLENSKLLIILLNNFSHLSVPVILIGCIVAFWNFRKLLFTKNPLFYSIITIVSFPIGYLVLLIESRYIWIISLLTLPLAAYFVSRMIDNNFFKKRRALYLISLCLGGILLSNFALSSAKYLKNYRYIDHTYFDQGKILKSLNITNSKVASNDDYHHSAYILFYSDNKYLGMPKKSDDFYIYEKQLIEVDTDYFLIWNTDKFIDQFREKYAQIQTPEIGNLYIFYLKKKQNY